MDTGRCQIHSLEEMADPGGSLDALWQRRNRVRRIIKRRWNFFINFLSRTAGAGAAVTEASGAKACGTASLQPGELVRIKSMKEIQETLNDWNQLKGCSFMEEMRPFCGTTQTVLKRIDKFLDERDYLIKKCKGIIILDGVFCEGTRDFGACDRTCFFFWREDWLERIV